MRSRVAAVAQLAEELVDEVAAVGEDQDAAGARGLDEAQRGDRLAGARRVLEPEALGGVGVLGLLGELLVVVLVGLLVVLPVDCGSSSGSSSSSSSRLLLARDRGATPSATSPLRRRRRALPLPLRCASASSAVSVPDSASTWWGLSSVPSASCGSSSASTRSSPSSSDVAPPPLDRRVPSRPASISASAASSARRRGRAGRERLVARPRRRRTKGSRVNARRARWSLGREGTRPATATAWVQP